MIALRHLYFSFALRLVALHLRNHVTLIAIWVFLVLLSGGMVGRFFGLHYLMLTPEYLGEVNFWSFFITGAAFGAMLMIWNLTTYLLAADRFPFLATLNTPFTKFCLNNSLIPLGFLSAYLFTTIWFQWHDELTRTGQIIAHVGGFLCGLLSLVILLAVYLNFTNKEIGSFLKPGNYVTPRPGRRLLAPGLRLPTIWEIQAGETRWRVDTYLTERLRTRRVRSVAHYDQEMLSRVFQQNHWNAVVVQLFALALLMTLGIFMENPWVRIPTAASIFLLASMAMALFGAITFWFRNWGFLVFITLLLVVNYFTGLGYLNYRNRAYGLDYKVENRVIYTNESVRAMYTPRQLQRDQAATRQILNRWLAKNQTAERPKPKITFICVSGGGLRSALWTTQTLQRCDQVTDGRLLRQTALMSGASGGMLGAALIREANLRRLWGESVSEHDSTLFDDLGRDLLNPVSFAIASNDLFFPLTKFRSGNFIYRKDRGYLFEHQLNENCRGMLDRRLAEYRLPEQRALIPMMIVSPALINDARRLLISPQGVSYLMQPPDDGRYALHPEIDGVDFGLLFRDHQADSLAFTSALRMNCTFPFILPNAWLPTNPGTEVIDAGFRDNYGIATAARFIHVFRDWIAEHTSGVLIVQIRCWEKVGPISPSDTKGFIENIMTPASAAASITDIQDYEQDNSLAMLDDLLGRNRLEVIRFTYRPVRKQREASMSLHLSKREKIDIREAFLQPENQLALTRLRRALAP